MLKYEFPRYWPSPEELPDSDDTPVDNELQDLIPSLLKATLAMLWSERTDWFFGIDMGVYYHGEKPPFVPDGFLSLGVERVIDEDLRLSYAIWEEERVPILMLEVVSQTHRGEYSTKMQDYANLGALFYVIYNPLRRKKQRLEVHRLVNNKYELQSGNPILLAEIGLGIGCERGTYQGITREWLYWYDEQGQRLLTPEELALSEQQRRQQAEQRASLLAERLRSLGIDPDTIA
ncbi:MULTISPECIES: Uma2 family endonuclease [Aerosakkonema]|uniref:Uma2 family endonuclease n=1 Tax=Aerosakkonema TaxID=1246629 RepID=UPI0035B74AF2